MSNQIGDNEIEVALTANFSDLADGMQGATEATEAGASAMADAIADSSAAIQKSYEEILAAQNASMAQTSQMLAAQQEAAAAAKASTGAIQEEAAATAELGTISGGVARELGVLSGEAMRGNFTRLEGSMVTLANRAGILQSVFSPLGVAILGTVAAGAYLIDQFIQAEERASAFEAALLSTGNAAGLTASQLQAASDQISAFSGDSRAADEIVLKLAQSGKLSGDALVNAGQAAANVMRLTGASADEAAKQVETLADNPVEAVVKLNDKWHFLTIEVFDHIKALQDAGKQYEATEAAATAFADATTERVEKLNEQMGFFEKQISYLKIGYETIDNAMQKAFDPTLAQKSADATHEWMEAQNALNTAIKNGASQGHIDDLRDGIAVLKERAQALREQVLEQQKANAVDGQKSSATAALIDEVQEQDKLNAHLKDTSILQEKIAEEKQRVESIHTEDPGNESIKGIDFDSSGAVAGGEQWEAIIQKLTKEYGETSDAARKAAEAARKAAQEAINDLEIQREQTQAGSSERMALDEKIEQTALQLYGKDSSEYKRAVAEKVSDDRAAAAEHKRLLDEQTRQQEQALGEQNRQENEALDNKKRQYEEDYQNGTINAKQLLAFEQQIANQRLNIDIAYYKAKEALDKGNQLEIQKDEAAIVTAHLNFTKQMQQADMQYTKNMDAEWKSAATKIEGSFQTAFNSIIFQGQKTKSALASVAESIGEDLIQAAIEKPLERWIAAEAAKLAASIATSTGVSSANTQQTTQDTISQKAATAQSVANAVAVAGAQGVASFAGAPWPVDIGAPAFGAEMAGMAATYGSVASAAGGWENIPSDQLAMVHQREMILPANVADHVRNSVSAGPTQTSSGGNVTHVWNIQAIDAKSFQQSLRSGLGNQLARYVNTKTTNKAAVRS